MGRNEQKSITRAKILVYGKSIFIQKGIGATSMSDVARHAGVSHGTVFFHFKSREALIEAIIDESLNHRLEPLSRIAMESDDISEYLNGYFDIIEDEQDAFSMMARELPLLPPATMSILETKENLIIAGFISVYDRGVSRNRYRQIDHEILIALVFGAIHHFLRFNYRFDKKGRVIRILRQRFLDALNTALVVLR
jgi:AcrR family transcriptional regulator